MADLYATPGAGITPTPGPRPVADLDAIGEVYVAYCEARDSGSPDADWLARQCADLIPVLRDEIHRVELLRRELAAELERLAGLPCADTPGELYATTQDLLDRRLA